ncbi:MAG: class I SAM-dependent methyltransferase [Pseudomonadota bacterium]
MDRQAHWNAAYTAKSETQVSWFQEVPARSLAMINAAHPTGSVIDVGGGASRLVDALLQAGDRDITVLDISEAALDRARTRLGDKAALVRWICADITQWKPDRQWDIWHDRAVFHFLTEEPAQDAYIAALTAATHPGSAVIIATFAPSGPERCSGLPVRRYSPADLAQRLGQAFALYDEAAEKHVTPWGAVQDFACAALRRM